MTSHEPELPDPEIETGGELDHTATAIPLETLVGSNLEETEDENDG